MVRNLDRITVRGETWFVKSLSSILEQCRSVSFYLKDDSLVTDIGGLFVEMKDTGDFDFICSNLGY
jgi:hypothetical protein